MNDKDPQLKEQRAAVRILVAEDETSVRKLLVRFLRGMGYTVHSAADGKEAVELCEGLDEPPHLLLSDVVMPEMDGPTLARTLRERHSELRLLFISGFSDNRFAIEGLTRDHYEFLAKPFALSDLGDKVHAMTREFLSSDIR